MAFILAVGGTDHQQIAHRQHFAVGGFMRKDTQAGAHVELPGDVGRSVVLEDLLPIRTTVLAIAETLRVEGTELALGGDVVQTVPFHIRRTRRRRQQELPQAALHSRGHVLPEERAIRRPKGHEHAALVLKGGVHLPGVVGPHIDRIAGHHGTAKRVVSQLDAPDDVPPGGRIPVDRRIARVSHGRPGVVARRKARARAARRQALQTRRQRFDSTPTRLRHAARDRLRPLCSASRAACAFGPMLPSAPAAKMRT